MLKKFKKWREDLTWKQVKKIMCRVGIVMVILCVISLISKLDYFLYERVGSEKIPVWVFIVISFICICMIEFLIYLVLDGISKELEFEENKIKVIISSKLKEDEFTQVYLKQSRRNAVSVIILDVYDMYDIEYFAKKQGDDIYVVSKENGEILNDYTIKNVSFFDYNFQFEKEK